MTEQPASAGSSAPRDDTATDAAEAAPRSIHARGRDWIILDGGRSLTGTGHLAPARLRLIQFAHADDPGKPLLEVTASPRPIDELHDDELIALMESARDVPEYGPPGEPGSGDRRLRSGGGFGRDRRDSRKGS